MQRKFELMPTVFTVDIMVLKMITSHKELEFKNQIQYHLAQSSHNSS